MAKCMAVNAGSSSIKYKLYEMPEEKVICSGVVERIGHEDGIFRLKFNGQQIRNVLPIMDHGVGVDLILKALVDNKIIKSFDEIKAVGHRVVQGGKYFSKSVIFDDYCEEKVAELTPLDPLHAPAHLTGYHAFKKALPNAVAIAVFDTAFHQTMEEEDYVFPIPYEYTEKYSCRRYGAHGTSHNYLAIKGKEDYLKDVENERIISCHIGSGASLAAIRGGKCVATTMGLTPLGGVMMGTRTGDMDPSVMDYLCTCTGKDAHELYDEFNKKSGFLGVSGRSNDTRDIEAGCQEGDARCILAANLFARRVADFIGSYYVRLGGADLIIFSAGIGENAPYFRKLIIDRCSEALGIVLDEKANNATIGNEAVITTPESKIKVAVIPTDEEVMIARDCEKALEGRL